MNVGTEVIVKDGVRIAGEDIGGMRGRVIDRPGNILWKLDKKLRFVYFAAGENTCDFCVWIKTDKLIPVPTLA